MATYDKLLLLADGTDRTIMTAEHLREYLPGRDMKKIVIFHVVRSLPAELRELASEPACAALLESLKRQADAGQKDVLENLERAKKILVDVGVPESAVEIRLAEEKDGVADDIIAEARRGGYRAVMMRRRGKGSLENMILGSVAFKLLQSLTFIPVILVGRAQAVRRVLLAVDSSPDSMKAVDFVASALSGEGFEVCVFHAVAGLGAIRFDPERDAVRPLSSEDMSEEDGVDVYRRKVGRLVLGVRAKLIAAGFAADKVHVKVACGAHSRAEAIVRAAEENGYGTIVVGRRGLSRMKAFFMGRVSHAVVYEGKEFTVWVV